ncbi:uncharacterized protein B0H18DRAFT_175001 [Fomitopsis serialis]|uniref:uncharacterized protein n=1 Tax=Fomitopsis serialis TaxID=139415 RepID=UPI002008B559|nr:uncharacterized protein B0H18DRAFT_175001 [Neoantrodia serialis]KAH9929798.1 hypothetical protein B0H18DRAFT_175001 [Neoantrodia serialis]
MSDFHLVEPKGWDCDLHSIYCAYVGHFQLHNIPWFERSWGVFFETFEDFLNFEWPVITVTDVKTGRPHIVTRMSSVDAFNKMIKTRYGETLPKVNNIHFVTPFETNQRHLRKISDAATYKKVHATLPAALLAAQKARVKSGEPKTVRELWDAKDKTFLSIDFEWSERNSSTILEWGYAAMRCGALHDAEVWPPIPEHNYRRGHYIVGDHVDRIVNKHQPTFPWAYAFADSQVIPKAQLSRVMQAIISSLASPDSETTPNNLVLVGHGLHEDLRRLQEMDIKIPNNVLTLDTAAYDDSSSHRPANAMTDPSGKPRAQHTTLSLTNLIRSLGVDLRCTMHNAGNDAMMCLLALQLLLEPRGTEMPKCRPIKGRLGVQAAMALPVLEQESRTTVDVAHAFARRVGNEYDKERERVGELVGEAAGERVLRQSAISGSSASPARVECGAEEHRTEPGAAHGAAGGNS